MRLATVFNADVNEPRPVFELPGGERIELRELFAPRQDSDGLRDVPLFFTDLTRTVQYMDDVVDAVRQWATDRADRVDRAGATAAQPVNAWRFCPPIPSPRSFRSFSAFYDQGLPSFLFGNATSLVAHEAEVFTPFGCAELDFGLELGAIIGRGGSNIPARNAWKHVAGFTIVNRFVARDLPPSKSNDFATAVGPYLVTFDALRDRIDSEGNAHLGMTARINGSEVSRANAAAMNSTWPDIIEYASRDAELFPGDLIASGTAPTGSIFDIGGEKFDRWLRPGDVVELEIERLGVLRTPIIARQGGSGRNHATIHQPARA